MSQSSPKIAYVTAGAAGMYCGSCLHDNTLARELHRMDVDIQLIPTYTPIRTDEENVAIDRVFLGGINVYLEQFFPPFRYLPSWLTSWLDRPGVLRWATSQGIETDARRLGAMTVSMLRGRDGYQRKEVRKLAAWIAHDLQPDLVVLTNTLLAGCVPALKAARDVSVLINLQGDDVFLDALVEPYRSESLPLLRRLLKEADGFLVNSQYYAAHMAAYLDIPPDRIHRVPLGVDVGDFTQAFDDAPATEVRPPTIGYLARLAPAKGLHLAVDAFIQLRGQPGLADARLHLAGWLGKSDREYAEEQFRKLRDQGLGDAFVYAGSVDRRQKIEFLRGIDVLSVPTTYQEPKGLYVLESLAAGVPVVQPEHGAFPEMLAATGGGRLTPPNDSAALAHEIGRLLADPVVCQELGQTGRAAVLQQFNARKMAEQTLAVYEAVVANRLA
jgi:glycosyltransferase involved in cell wall biosynthesis